jgi:hypothetical protein
MTVTIVGRFADELGHYRSPTGPGAIPAANYRAEQPRAILLDLDHGDETVGQVDYLEADAGLWAVAESPLDGLAEIDAPVYYSPEVAHRDGRDAELHGLALTHRPASVGAVPVTIVPGSLAAAAARSTGELHARLARAVAYRQSRRPGDRHRIARPYSLDERSAVSAPGGEFAPPGEYRRPLGVPVEHAACGRVLRVW